MAIYHLSVKPISRAGGRSATAAAAYRSGELVHDLTSDEVFDYTRKRGVEHSEIVLPTAAARADINWARDREALWNAAEIAEVRKDARVAREYEVALPHELNRGQRVELVRAFAGELANRYGVAVDFSIHLPHRSGDDRNHHAHIMTTTREVTATGLGPKAAIEWSDTDRRKKGLEPAKSEVKAIRERWAALTNEHLLERGIGARVDHRSLQEQGIDREPQSHLGPAVSGMERRGMETEVGKRISWEMQAAAQARLERAAEIGKLAREREQLQLSTLDLSGDLKLAKEERARAVPEPKAKEIASGMSLAERLDMLSDEVAKRLEAEAAPERAAREEEARRRALDVTQQQDLEHGRGRSRGRSIGDDDDELKRKLDRGKDFGLER
ncbi:MAG: MobQ family relaxase [Terriglobales bacterium]